MNRYFIQSTKATSGRNRSNYNSLIHVKFWFTVHPILTCVCVCVYVCLCVCVFEQLKRTGTKQKTKLSKLKGVDNWRVQAPCRLPMSVNLVYSSPVTLLNTRDMFTVNQSARSCPVGIDRLKIQLNAGATLSAHSFISFRTLLRMLSGPHAFGGFMDSETGTRQTCIQSQ